MYYSIKNKLQIFLSIVFVFLGFFRPSFCAFYDVKDENLPFGTVNFKLGNGEYSIVISGDTTKKDTSKKVKNPWDYKVKDQGLDVNSKKENSPLLLKDPANLKTDVEVDDSLQQYTISQKIGKNPYRPPTVMTYEEYNKQQQKNTIRNYWKEKAASENVVSQTGLIPKIYIGPKVFDRIFGGNYVDIKPNGQALLKFAGSFNRTDDPTLTQEQQSQGGFNFDQQIQMNVVGSIGEKLKITANWNTEASFDFENQLKLEYTGYEEEIIQKIEAGNVSLPLNSSLITGAQNLFGIKTQLKFGRLTVTTLASQQKGKKEELDIEGGAQSSNFELRADDYDANRHYFLCQSFREQYKEALKGLPYVKSSINVTRVEIWVTNKRNAIEGVRNLVGFMDLGEKNPFIKSITVTDTTLAPSNLSNILYQTLLNSTAKDSLRTSQTTNTALKRLRFGNDTLVQGRDFQKVDNARKLQANEYKLNAQLGFISLNTSLNSDEVLAVAYEYSIDGKKYQVGEFSQDITPNTANPNVLFLKLIKPVSIRTDLPTWKLMMKNIYSIGAYQVNKQDFQLNIYYKDDKSGFNQPSLPASSGRLAGKPLIELLNLDNLNSNKDNGKDGAFDFIENVTIDATQGRIYFPQLEPFGDDLRELFKDDPNKAIGFVFDDLYDKTKNDAQQNAELNKFYLRGKYLSSSSAEIPLNAINVIKGSVVVTAGGAQLTENQDYTVDYILGKVTIINQGILNSGQKIKVKFETNTFFTIQSKSLIGSRFDYKIHEDLSFGASVLKLHERPITPKIDIGDEPISNTIWGLDAHYKKDSRFVTKMIDKLPFLRTKEISTFTFNTEFAQLRPGHPSSIEDDKGQGKAYIDDFESSKIPFDMFSAHTWKISGTPQRFPQGNTSVLDYGKNRAKISWYVIDPIFFREDNSATPKHIKDDKDQLSSHYVREVLPKEVFPNRDATVGETNLPTLDLAYYPNERGPYNYDSNVDKDGKLLNPEKRWGGITKAITSTTDFESANIEFIEFWILDPFIKGPNGSKNTTGGVMYLNLGNVTEDILKDSRKQFEDGLPKTAEPKNVDTTDWGRVSTQQSIAHAFDNTSGSRKYQDLGLDGLDDEGERSYFDSVYLEKIKTLHGVNSDAYKFAATDPSNDNYHFYRGKDLDGDKIPILGRYKQYNGLQGNSPDDSQNPEDYPTLASNSPDDEDINRDNTLNELEEYYEYKINLHPQEFKVGKNYISDRVVTEVKLKNGSTDSISWYQFRVPVRQPDNTVGNITDFKSIRYMRIYLTDFSEEVILRIAKLQLIGSPWRRYNSDLKVEGPSEPNDPSYDTKFDISSVNIEENGTYDGTNIPYMLPPGIGREVDVASANQRKQNEQSLELCVGDLQDGDARATYKNISLDFRNYKKIRMWVHAENKSSPGSEPFTQTGQLTAFIRLGTDFTKNYYEFEIPLEPTIPPVSPNSADATDRIWIPQNEMNVTFEGLGVAKADRNEKKIPLDQPHTILRGGRKITVVGNPDLGAVKTIMIGVRNPKDNGRAVSGCIWVNELRVSDFVEEPGWAANARINAKLADVATITAAGSHMTAGFGSIETKISDRTKVNTSQYDLSSNIELSKFMPESFSLRVPMFTAYGETFVVPKYDPLNQDVLMEAKLDALNSEKERDSVNKVVIDYTRRRSINFTNVQRVRKTGKKVHLWDVENLALTYAYNESYRRNINTEYDTLKNYRGGIAYTYNNSSIKNYQPFQKIEAFKPPRYRLIKDFNYSLFPRVIGFRTDLDRKYGTTRLRQSDPNTPIIPTFNKSFTMDRVYDFKWDITKALKLDITATNNTRIDEPDGTINKHVKDSIISNLKKGGRTTRYNQTSSLDYKIPIDKLPWLDWVSANTRYTGGYTWTAAPTGNDSLGNTIQNSANTNWNGMFNLTTLYNKSKYLQSLNKGGIKSSSNMIPATATTPAKKDTTKTMKDNSYFKKVLRAMMTIRSVNWTYQITKGTFLPGYLEETKLFGNDWRLNPIAPGLPFVLGWQESQIHTKAANNNWLTKSKYLNTLYTNTQTTRFTVATNLEPFNDFKVTLNWSKNTGLNKERYYHYNDTSSSYKEYSFRETGNYGVSLNTWRTSFSIDNKDGENSTFEQFEDNRQIVAKRMNTTDYNQNYNFPGGGYYDINSQDVLIPSFIAAYKGRSAEGIAITPFPVIPLPNWRMTYAGLSKIDWAKEFFTSVNLSHNYISNYTVSAFTTNLDFIELKGNTGLASNFKSDGTFYTQYTIDRVNIKEQYAPMLGIDLSWKNNVTTKFEYKRSRDLNLSLSNIQLTEMRTNEYVIGAGYRKTGLNIPFNFRGKQIVLKNELTFRFDVGYSTTLTYQREVDGNNTITSGMNVLKIGPNIEYVVNQKFRVKLYYDRTATIPAISTASPNYHTEVGVEIKFSLTQ